MGYKREIPKLMFDTKAMNQDIPIKDVIRLYTSQSPDAKRRGENIHCPSPSHDDKHASAHIYGNGCKCFSCNRFLSPVSLAKEVFPEMHFADLCQKMCQDFGLSPYHYSNLAEVENALQAKKENKFYEHFPVSEVDLQVIGLNGCETGEVEITYSVKAIDYFNHFYGEVPPRCSVHNEFGNDIIMQISSGEAQSMGIATATDEKHEYIKTPRLREVWQSDMLAVEAMILDKCQETIDHMTLSIEANEFMVAAYRESHTVNDIKEADRLRSGYINARMNGINVVLKPEQEEKINSLYEFEAWKRDISHFREVISEAQEISAKVINHQKEREQAQKEAQHKKSWHSRQTER